MTLSSDDLTIVQLAAEASVQRALLHTIVPVIRHGVVLEPHSFGPRIHEVQMDGDTLGIPVHDVTTGQVMAVGARVTVLFSPPHQPMIIGQVTSPGPIQQQRLTSSSSTIGGTGLTDMALDAVPMVAGETYLTHLHTPIENASVAIDARFILNLQVTGTTVGRFFDSHTRVTGVTHMVCDAWVQHTPDTTGNYDLDVQANQITVGSSLVLEASSTAPRTLTVYHVGVLPA